MLSTLRVANVGTFADVTVEFDEGLTVLTGETGAGKTLLVGALHLVLGGSDRAVPVLDAAMPSLVEATFVDGTDEVVAARERSATGRLRAMLDGVTTSAKLLAERTTDLCQLHGQHEHQVLRKLGTARAILDGFGAIDDSEVRGLRRQCRELVELQARLGGAAPERRRHLELLAHERDEIDAVAPTGPNELDELLEEAVALTAVAEARESIIAAVEHLDTEGDGVCVSGLLAQALGGLPRALPSRAELADLLERSRSLAAELRRDLEAVDADPVRLDDLNGRIASLRDLVRKHGQSLDDVLGRRKELDAELVQLESDEARSEQLDAELAAARSALASSEATCLAARTAAGRTLAQRVQGRFGDLALPHARFEVSVAGAAGEDVTFLFAGSSGLAPAPLADAASGGELSRVMLALTLATDSVAGCTIFDEVDAGIGGATAVALAACLRELSADAQVIVVTHLASVAAVADHQLVVTPAADRHGARVDRVVGDDRIRELARMLAGDADHPDAVAHARALLAGDPAPT